MNTAWTFRGLMLITALAFVMFGDFFGYGQVRGVKFVASQSSRNFPDTTNNNDNNKVDNELSEDTSLDTINKQRNSDKDKLYDTIKESCLPKMLCEMASKPDHVLTDKEKDLLNMIKSSKMSLTMNSPPTRWHFAAHMGELMRFTSDGLSGPIGCANLWPNCPISSKKLMKLASKVNLK